MVETSKTSQPVNSSLSKILVSIEENQVPVVTQNQSVAEETAPQNVL